MTTNPEPRGTEEIARELVSKARIELGLMVPGDTTFHKFWEPIIKSALDAERSSNQVLIGRMREALKPFANCWTMASEKNKIVELPFGYYAKAQEVISLTQEGIEDEVAELNRNIKNWGIIEFMVRNVNVDSFVKEKEKIISDLKAKLEKRTEALKYLDKFTLGTHKEIFLNDIIKKALSEEKEPGK